MEVLSPYSTTVFNSLGPVDTSSMHFDTHGGTNLLNSTIQDLFVKYGLTSLLGLSLVHRHFSLESNEALVKVNGSSTPWSLVGAQALAGGVFEKYRGRIKPCSWLVSKGRLMPYEFYFEEPQTLRAEDQSSNQDAEINPDFVRDFEAVLATHDLTNVLGLHILEQPMKRSIEVTEGRANVSFPAHEDNAFNSNEYISTSWTYRTAQPTDGKLPPIIQLLCQGTCLRYKDTHISGAHIKRPTPPPTPSPPPSPEPDSD